ncbi:MAG: preprotein translocase subunit SecE [Calditrichaeota bacterium]|nr:MAG: preprotein translocase subunit SecE [Calditrichota bacterium]
MIQKIKDFLEGVKTEMRKVSWPDKEELMNATFVVCVISAIFTLFIYLADLVMSQIVSLLY